MRRWGRRLPELDFLIIGAQKSGTTSLWRYLEDNPAIRMPPNKEAPFFTESGYPHDFGRYMRALFKDAPLGARLGDCSPVYMHGANGVDVPTIAARISTTTGGVRLVALLRDPVDRAHSAHRMFHSQNVDERSFAEAIGEQLAPPALERARRDPSSTTTYVVAGEYGRILGAYLEHFRREQLLVTFTEQLERDPMSVVAEVCSHLAVEPHLPKRLGERFHVSGAPRVDEAGASDLLAYLERQVWPHVRHAEQHRHAFESWFRLWNTASASDPLPERGIDEATAAALRSHYEQDTERLAAIIGGPPPWA